MTHPAILVDNLSKQYRIGQIERYRSLRESLVKTFVSPIRNLNRPIPLQEKPLPFWALQGISFSVASGEIIGVIGRNGAGKSTLLKILARITRPTRGRARIYGRVGSLLEVGTGFHPELTGRENIYLNGAIIGMKKGEIQRKFDEIVSFAEIEQFLDTPVKRYSSGMYVRLAFAVAAHLEPEILLVDEVLSVGDAAFQRKSLGKMGEVVQAGRTVLFVSHQLSMVNTLCDRAILLDEGRLVADGETSNVVEHYLKSFILSQNDSTMRIFEIDPSKRAQILKATLLPSTPKSASPIDVFEPLRLEIIYACREELEGVSVNIVVRRDGEILFVSFDSDNHPELLRNRPEGTYVAKTELPSPLKAGYYTIDISLGKLNVGGLDLHKEALSFVVQDLSFDSSMRSYGHTRPGVMAVHLNWENRLLDSARGDPLLP